MDLEDQIINAGPYVVGDMIRAWMLPPNLTAAALNTLRDQLIELRQLKAAAEAREQYDIAPGHAAAYGRMTCLACYEPWEIRDPLTLAELNRRAGEHTEVCR